MTKCGWVNNKVHLKHNLNCVCLRIENHLSKQKECNSKKSLPCIILLNRTVLFCSVQCSLSSACHGMSVDFLFKGIQNWPYQVSLRTTKRAARRTMAVNGENKTTTTATRHMELSEPQSTKQRKINESHYGYFCSFQFFLWLLLKRKREEKKR